MARYSAPAILLPSTSPTPQWDGEGSRLYVAELRNRDLSTRKADAELAAQVARVEAKLSELEAQKQLAGPMQGATSSLYMGQQGDSSNRSGWWHYVKDSFLRSYREEYLDRLFALNNTLLQWR